MSTSPASGRSRPATMLSSVDLPLPDSPRIATHSPRATSRSSAAKSGVPANDLASPRTWSINPVSEPGDDAERRAANRRDAGAREQPALLREHGDRGERDGDLQQRHRD